MNPTVPGRASMSVSFRGVRGSIPCPGSATARYGGNTACLSARIGDQVLILDAGSGIRGLGHDLAAEFGDRSVTATILISHTHWDHIQGLPFFAPAYAPRNRIRLMAAPGKGETLRRALHQQMDPIHFPVGLEHLVGLTSGEELASQGTQVGAFQVRVAPLNHPGGCTGFRVETAGGTFAYLPDHEPFERAQGQSSRERTDALIEFVSGVDLLVLDTQYTEAEYPSRRGWGHGCLIDSVTMGVQAGVRQLALFHHDPIHNDEQIDAMVARGRELALHSGLIVDAAAESETITLSRASAPAFPSPLPELARVAQV